jgi:hypothetical protein
VFSGADSNGKTLAYQDGGYVDVYLNGVLLQDTTDYTATTKTSVTLTSGATAGDLVEIIAYGIFSVGDTVSAANGGTFKGNVAINADLTVDTDTLYVDSTNNRVGVGTASPSQTLHVYHSTDNELIRVESGDVNANIIFEDSTTTVPPFIGATGDDFRFITNNTERARIDSNGNLLVGGTSQSGTANKVMVKSAGKFGLSIIDTTAQAAGVGGALNLGGNYRVNGDAQALTRIAALKENSTDNNFAYAMGFYTTPNGGTFTERARIDSSGNLLVGTTDSSVYNNGSDTSADTGINLNTTFAGFARYNGTPVYINRTGSNGDILTFNKSGTTVGKIGTPGTVIFVANATTGGINLATSGSQMRLCPCDENGSFEDNFHDIGDPGVRWDDIYATNTSIIGTSDANEKQQIASLTDAEITAAKALSKLFKTFKWNSAVEAKGDNARLHTGHIAQEVEQAMTDAGLDASRYGFWCSNTWWETQTEVPAVAEELDEDGNVITEAKEAYTRTDTYATLEEAPEGATERTRLGIRYPELLAFISAATEQRLTSIEARLEALETA